MNTGLNLRKDTSFRMEIQLKIYAGILYGYWTSHPRNIVFFSLGFIEMPRKSIYENDIV